VSQKFIVVENLAKTLRTACGLCISRILHFTRSQFLQSGHDRIANEEFDLQDDQQQMEAHLELAKLQLEHDDFHAAIDAMIAQKSDPMKIQRMKKKKLELKDRIKKLSSRIIPDIIA